MMKNKNVSTTRLLAGGIIGNTLEWFDFAVYGFFAVIIGKNFFPKEDPVAQVIAAFGIFAVGFMMRPLGGILIGFIGDRYGRQRAMLISVAAMAIPTFLVGVLPTYAAIGLAAPALLLLLRMVQGLSVGGEYTTSIVYMVEHCNPKHRGLVGSLACVGSVVGILLGSALGALLASVMSAESLQVWGWRVPFICGLVIGLAGLVLRREGSTPEAVSPKVTHNPLKMALSENRGVMAQVAGISMMTAVVFYLVFVYLVSWLELVDGISPAHSLAINTGSMLVLIPVMMIAGALSDKFNPRLLMMFASGLTVICAWPLFWAMHSDTLLHVMIGQIGFSLLLGVYLGVAPAYMVQVIPPNVRCTAAGFSYNVTLGIAGGLTPMFATWLVSRLEDDLSPSYMVIVAALISFYSLWTMRDRKLIESNI
jgi:MHS family proline/betaine transporter-like MFS transporter